MFIRNADEVDATPMGMEGAKGVTMRLMVGRDDGAPTFSMRVFEVAPGGHTPHHHHNYEHEVMVLEGAGEVTADGRAGAIKAGDVVFMPPNEPHQFRNTGTSPLRFVCLVPTHFDCGADACQPTPGA